MQFEKAAAGRMDISQPKVLAMLRGDFTNLSEGKLMNDPICRRWCRRQRVS